MKFEKRFYQFSSLLVVLFLVTLISCKKDSDPTPTTKLTDRWEKMSDVGGKRDDGFNFAANGKGYVGAGSLSQKDFWEYDPTSNVWTQKQDFKGEARVYSTSFGVGSKGYVIGGFGFGNNSHKDVWEYDPTSNNWTQKNDFNSGERFAAVSFTIGSKGYVGTGGIISSSTVLKDFWEYHPSNDSWTKKANLPGEPRERAFAFAIGQNGYIGGGTGVGGTGSQRTFYEYNVSIDQWISKSELPQEFSTQIPNAFVSSSKGYVSGDSGKQLWQFDPATNAWTRKADPPTQVIGVGYTIGNYGYLGDSYEKNFYRYTPE